MIHVTARLPIRLMPADRDLMFAAPLDDILRRRGKGEVTGGGTLQRADGSIVFVDLDLALADAAALDLAADVLAFFAAPKGSLLLDAAGAELRRFGTAEVLAIALDGTGLDPQVYADWPAEAILAAMEGHMGEAGRFMGSIVGPRTTELIFAGPAFAAMQAALAPMLTGHPICAGARVERVV